MAGTLRGPRAKIERAKKHVREFEAALGELTFSNARHPQVILVDDDLKLGQKAYKLGHVPEIPDAITAIAGDAIHNMRTALDQLVTALIERNRQPGAKVYFPTGWNRKDFEARCKSEVERRVGQDALDLIRATEAHRGGKGDALWRVHRLDVEDKHKILYTLAFDFQSMTLAMPKNDVFSPKQQAMFGRMMDELFWRPADNMLPLKEGDVLFYGPPDPVNDPKFRLGVTFSEPEIVKGKTVLETLVRFGEHVESTVESFAPLF